MKIKSLGAPATASVPSFLLLDEVNLSSEAENRDLLDMIFVFYVD